LLLHNDTVSALKFSPDGRWLLSGGDDHCAQLWDVTSGRPKGPPLPHPDPITIAVFGPDGRSLFTFCEDRGTRQEAALWDLNRGQKRQIIRVPRRVISAAFCDEGRALLVGDIEGNLQLYDASSGEPTGQPVKQNGPVYSLEFSRDEQTLLTGLGSGGAILWDWKARRQLKKLPLGEGMTYVYFYSDKGGLLLLQNGFVHVWDQSGGARKPPPLFGAEGGIGELAFAPDSRSVLIRDAEARARLLDVATGKRIGPAPGQTGVAPRDFLIRGRYPVASSAPSAFLPCRAEIDADSHAQDSAGEAISCRTAYLAPLGRKCV
jgi:WD40 repeat protein